MRMRPFSGGSGRSDIGIALADMEIKHIPLLHKYYRKHFPFRICAPSFIYPAGWADNAKLLGPFLDEIELLFFESAKENALPDEREISDLTRLSHETGLTYNVHLPTDISLGAAQQEVQENALTVINRVMKLAAPLNPTTWTLHLPFDNPQKNAKERHAWIDRLFKNLESLISSGVKAEHISIETLDYPFAWLEKILASLNVTICMDIGHLLLNKSDVRKFYKTYQDRINIIHLHGTKEGRDHLPLTSFSDRQIHEIAGLLHDFQGTVSVEVFNFYSLDISLRRLENALAFCHSRKHHDQKTDAKQ